MLGCLPCRTQATLDISCFEHAGIYYWDRYDRNDKFVGWCDADAFCAEYDDKHRHKSAHADHQLDATEFDNWDFD